MKKRQISQTYQTRIRQGEEKKILSSRSDLWKKLKEYRDVRTLAKKIGVSEYIVSRAINHGVGSLRTLKHIDKYFQQRITLLEKLDRDEQ